MNSDTQQVHYSQSRKLEHERLHNFILCACGKSVVRNTKTNEIEYEYVQDLKDKKVFIWFDSKAMGDAIAWMPVLEQFRLKHKCKVIASTFHNNLFEDEYAHIQFEPPENGFKDFDFKYKMGWKLDATHLQGGDYLNLGLQECASKILGLDYSENAC